jgi:hypothetical protein
VSQIGHPEADDVLHDAWRGTAPASPHLDEGQWELLLGGRIDAATREAALDHIAACTGCATVFKQARIAARTSARSTAAPGRAARRQWYYSPQFAAVAALLTVTVGAVILTRQTVPTVATFETSTTPSSRPVTPVADPLVGLRAQKPPVVIGAELLLVTRSGPGEQKFLEDLARALDSYKADDYAEAARQLSGLAAARPEVFEATYYLGISLLLDGKAAESVVVLERAESIAGDTRRAEAARFVELARNARGSQDPRP